jgi:uncharacterized CHY-type Zn-finger protein
MQVPSLKALCKKVLCEGYYEDNGAIWAPSMRTFNFFYVLKTVMPEIVAQQVLRYRIKHYITCWQCHIYKDPEDFTVHVLQKNAKTIKMRSFVCRSCRQETTNEKLCILEKPESILE